MAWCSVKSTGATLSLPLETGQIEPLKHQQNITNTTEEEEEEISHTQQMHISDDVNVIAVLQLSTTP
jgi:hypothetical protein